jgi:cephalosporin hydroxylase
MVILDSNHTHDHVLEELKLYAPLVTRDQFLIVADTVVEDIPAQTHRPRPWGPGNNPATAMRAFLATDKRFAPDPFVNAKLLLTSSPGGYLRRVAD